MNQKVLEMNQEHYARETIRRLLFGSIVYSDNADANNSNSLGDRSRAISKNNARLVIEITAKHFVIACEPNKGQAGKEETLKAMELITELLESYGIPFISTSRNRLDPDKVNKTDRIIIKRVSDATLDIIREMIIDS